MITRVLGLCGALLLLPVPARAAATVDCAEPVVTGASFSMTCRYAHQSMPLTLVMQGTVDDAEHDLSTARATPQTIDVRDATGSRQTLTVASDDGVLLNDLPQQAFTSIDLDFDGMDDLQVWTETSAGPNGGYAFWLYDKPTGKFVRRDDLDALLSGFEVSSDTKQRTVSVSARESCCAWSVSTYHWTNARLMPISDAESGMLDVSESLGDVPGIRAFAAKSAGGMMICATVRRLYDSAGKINGAVIETEGDPCEDAQDYRKTAAQRDKALNGTRRHGAVSDEYRNGVLLRRTVVFDPPKAK